MERIDTGTQLHHNHRAELQLDDVHNQVKGMKLVRCQLVSYLSLCGP